MLQFCVSQQINTTKSFAFKATGIRVYSFEEVMYHIFHYWRESVDEFLSDKMICWVGELGHSYLAARMKELAQRDAFSERVLNFLQIIDYFNKTELAELETNLRTWEERLEWEKLKERGDFFAHRGELNKALALYKQALQYEENVIILNNAGVVCMQMQSYEEAVIYLSRAIAFLSSQPNLTILLSYIEALILNGNYDKAETSLENASRIDPQCSDIPFMYGLMEFEQKQYTKALLQFKRAIEFNAESSQEIPLYVYKMVEVYCATRQYDKAVEALEQVTIRDEVYYSHEATLHAVSGDIPAAIKSMNMAIKNGTPNANLWAKLASYYRLNYDTEHAETAITTALHLDPDSDIVRLESARIKKGRGRTREYQVALFDVLNGFKERYRTVD